MTFVSVYCTVKNGQKNITTMVCSVIEQTYKNWELVIVDDGSSDNTLSILDSYTELDSRIKVIKTNGVGRAKALNIALDNCSGSILCNLDSDDVFFPYKIEQQLKVIDNNSVVFSRGFVFSEDHQLKLKSQESTSELYYNRVDKLYLYNKVNHSSVMYSRTLLDLVGVYNESLKSNIDYEFWLRMISFNVNFIMSNIPMVGKRIHKEQSFENKKRFRYLLSDLKLKIRYIRSSGLPWYNLFYVVCRFFYGLMPSSFRMFIRKKLL